TQRRELYKRVPSDPISVTMAKMKVWTLQVSDPPEKFSRTLEIKSLDPPRLRPSRVMTNFMGPPRIFT
ncbi:MAG: hypothetical protein ACK56F_32810, partial [bacterium]